MVDPNRTDYVLTNDFKQISTSDDATNGRPNNHREIKQLTGIEKYQARNARAQRKHIIVVILT